jgi:hypothetical protein
MKLYGAIDLHTTNSVLVVIDEADKIVYQKRLPNDLALILKELCVYQSRLEGIVVESTYNWYWLVDGLMEQGYKVHLANTAAIQQYEGLKYSNDDSDARWLAHVLAWCAPQGYIYPEKATRARSIAQEASWYGRSNESEHSESDDAQHRMSMTANQIKDSITTGRWTFARRGSLPGGEG